MNNLSRKTSKTKRIVSTQPAGMAVNKAEVHPATLLMEQAFGTTLNQVTPTTTPTQATHATTTTPPNYSNSTEPISEQHPVAPIGDFQKVPNTITRQAIPNGLFRSGKSKQIYDVLYSLTRGAIRPTRKMQISRSKLTKLAGIGSRITMDSCLANLEAVGLIKVTIHDGGQHAGNEYEVFMPEEIRPISTPTTATTPTHGGRGTIGNRSSPTHKIGVVAPLQNRSGSSGSQAINIESAHYAKTFLKDIKEGEDDERYRAAFTDLEKVLNKAVENLTGREATEADKERWKQVADILAAQLELIASRTTISNAPAVLAEHLHRQLNSQRALERMGLITPKEARAAKKESQQNHFAQTEEGISEETTLEESSSDDTIPDLYLCPDCDGTTYWNPDGRGRQAGCPHSRLEEAREQRAQAEE